MECPDITLHLDDMLDGRLDAPARMAFEDHLARCADCRRRHEHAAAVQDMVRKLVPPAMHPGFVDRALSRATRPAAPRARSRPVIGMALAASVVLGAALGVFFATRPVVQSVALTLEQPQTVRVMFNSAKPLKAATLSLELPDNVELVGYGGRRELSWQTDLLEGGNLMQLPLIVHAAPKEDLVARLSHGDSTKTFRLKIELASAGKGL